jgi:serine/threonine protein kinase/WD40 repeat protein
MEQLRSLRLGDLAEPEAVALESHILQCDSCLRALKTLEVNDALVEGLRGRAKTTDQPNPDLVERLIRQVKQQLPAAEAPTADVPAAATPPPDRPRPPDFAFLAPPQAEGEIGRLSHYRILAVLGWGGMGIVFRAHDPRLKREVALKVMSPALAGSASARERFLREARAMAAIEHDHIIQVFHVDEDRGVPFLVMPLLKGETLDARLVRAGASRPLPMAEVLRIGREAAEGLAAAHAQGQIHRDVKPSNLWLEGQRGRVKILDFGLARVVAEDVKLTEQGRIVGTPDYMAPEQAQNKPVDARCDLFSLGCVLYRLCTGELPFKGPDTLTILMALATEHPAPASQVNPNVPAALSNLIDKLLAKNPAERPASAQEVADRLEQIEKEQAHSEPYKPPRPRWPLIAAAALGLVTAGLLLLVIIINALMPPEEDSRNIANGENGLGPLALVTHPAPIDGLRGWTIETIGHRGPVQALAFRPDGRHLATGGADGTIRIWDLSGSGVPRPQSALLGHTRGIWCLAWSPDGKLLASCGRQYDSPSVRIWKAETGEQLKAPPGVDGQFDKAVFSPGGEWIAVANGKVVWVWKVGSDQEPVTRTFPKDEIKGIALSPEGKTLAVALQAEGIVLWQHQTEDEPRRLLKTPVYRMGWRPDGKTLVYFINNAVHFLDAHSGKEQRQPVPIPFANTGYWALSADGNTLSAAADNVAQCWDAGTGKILRNVDWKGHSFSAAGRPFAFSPDGQALAHAGLDGTVQVWRPRSEQPTALDGHGEGSPEHLPPAWSHDGRTLAFVRSNDGTLRLWDDDRGLSPPHAAGAILALGWLDHKTLLWADGSNNVTALDTTTSKSKECLHLGGNANGLRFWLSPDATRLAAFDTEHKQVTLYEPHAGKLLRTLDTAEAKDRITEVWGWAHDGKTLVACGQGNEIQLWDVATGKRRPERLAAAGADFATLSPDGKSLAYRNGNQAFVLELASGNKVGPLPGEGGPLSWSPRGKRLTWGYGVCDPATGKRLTELHGAAAKGLDNIGWSPDGKTLAARLALGEIAFWDAATGQATGELVGLREGGWLALSPPGHYRGSPKVERQLVYVALTARGQETLRPSEFEERYGWMNEPAKVRLIGR